jgi:hypothetical protein
MLLQHRTDDNEPNLQNQLYGNRAYMQRTVEYIRRAGLTVMTATDVNFEHEFYSTQHSERPKMLQNLMQPTLSRSGPTHQIKQNLTLTPSCIQPYTFSDDLIIQKDSNVKKIKFPQEFHDTY